MGYMAMKVQRARLSWRGPLDVLFLLVALGDSCCAVALLSGVALRCGRVFLYFSVRSASARTPVMCVRLAFLSRSQGIQPAPPLAHKVSMAADTATTAGSGGGGGGGGGGGARA